MDCFIRIKEEEAYSQNYATGEPKVYMYFYKITKIVRALQLAERSVCMRVCKHGCGQPSP